MTSEQQTFAGMVPTSVAAGLLNARLADGRLTEVAVDGELVLDTVYAALRDQDWGTVPIDCALTQCRTGQDGFDIAYAARSLREDFPFHYSMRIAGRPGKVRIEFLGAADGDLWTNRIGFCLLHPLALTGTSVETVTGNQDWSRSRSGEFPARISPTTLFGEISGLRYTTAAGHPVTMTFLGDLFETEDQRNWIDGTFKTYCTPLRLPYPRRVAAGQTIEQAVAIGYPASEPSSRTRRAATRACRPARVSVGADRLPKPALTIGVGTASHRIRPELVDQVVGLRPDALTVEIDLTADWRSRWARAVDEAAAVGTALDVMLVTSGSKGIDDWADAARGGSVPIRAVAAYDIGTHVTSADLASALRAAMHRHGLQAPVGGGTRAHFAELNRMRLPAGLLDFVTYSANPQVHATEPHAIMQTPSALEQTLSNAVRLSGGAPVHVGPLTFAPRYNSVATSAAASLPGDGDAFADSRQDGPVAAAWTIGALAATARADTIKVFQTVGPHGLFATAPPGETEIWQVLRWWAGPETDLLSIDCDPPVVAVALIDAHAAVRVLVANGGDSDVTAEIRLAHDGFSETLHLAPWARHEVIVPAREAATRPATERGVQ